MNLNHNPMQSELAELLRACDDRAGHHVLWVDRGGEVRITLLADGTAFGFANGRPEAQLQFDYFESGHDYVGPGAARDTNWVEDVFITLLDRWAKAKGLPEVAFVEGV